LAVPQQRGEQVIEGTGQGRVVQQHLEDGQLGHVVRHARLVGGGLRLADREKWNTRIGHGVSTPCSGGTSSPSSPSWQAHTVEAHSTTRQAPERIPPGREQVKSSASRAPRQE